MLPDVQYLSHLAPKHLHEVKLCNCVTRSGLLSGRSILVLKKTIVKNSVSHCQLRAIEFRFTSSPEQSLDGGRKLDAEKRVMWTDRLLTEMYGGREKQTK